MAVEHQVRSHSKIRRVQTEVPWRDDQSDQDGFIDLLLEQANVKWVVECKRSHNREWVFLVPEGRSPSPTVCCLWFAGAANGKVMAGWDEVNLDPGSPEAMFCVVRGATSDGGDRLLERIAGQVVAATNCVADRDIALLKRTPKEAISVYVPVIVTTAPLHVCRFDPSVVSLKDGLITKSQFEEVPFVRFRKAFSTTARQLFPPPITLGIGAENEPTVLVINAAHLISFFNKAAMMPKDPDFGQWPWRTALAQLQGVPNARGVGIGKPR